MELIPMTGPQSRGCHASAARHQQLECGDHGVVASEARQHQVLVEGTLHGAGIGYPQNRVAGLYVVRDTQARLPLRGARNAIVLVEAHAQVKGPVVSNDCILRVESELLDVGMAKISILGAGVIGATVGSGQRPRSGEVVTAKNRIKRRDWVAASKEPLTDVRLQP